MPNKETFSNLDRPTLRPARLTAGENPNHLIVTGLRADRLALLERRLLSWVRVHPSRIGGAS